MNQPDPRLLRTFLMVAEELNFTHAAARLHLVQQTVSTQIRTLESQLGVRLFDRTTRKVQLTEAGIVLRDRARDAVLALEEAVREARATESVVRVRCGHSTSAGWHLLPAAVDVLERTAPDLVLDSTEHTPVDLLGALRGGVIEVAVGLELRPDGPDLAEHRVRCEPWMLAVGTSSPYARAAAVDLRELADADWINWPKETHPGYWDAAQRIFADAGIAPKPRPARIGIADYVRAINNGALGIAPTASIARPLPGITLVPITPEPRAAHYSVVWNPLAPPGRLEDLLAAFTAVGRL